MYSTLCTVPPEPIHLARYHLVRLVHLVHLISLNSVFVSIQLAHFKRLRQFKEAYNKRTALAPHSNSRPIFCWLWFIAYGGSNRNIIVRSVAQVLQDLLDIRGC